MEANEGKTSKPIDSFFESGASAIPPLGQVGREYSGMSAADDTEALDTDPPPHLKKANLDREPGVTAVPPRRSSSFRMFSCRC